MLRNQTITHSVSQDNEIKFINICYETSILCTYEVVIIVNTL